MIVGSKLDDPTILMDFHLNKFQVKDPYFDPWCKCPAISHEPDSKSKSIENDSRFFCVVSKFRDNKDNFEIIRRNTVSGIQLSQLLFIYALLVISLSTHSMNEIQSDLFSSIVSIFFIVSSRKKAYNSLDTWNNTNYFPPPLSGPRASGK